MQRRVVVDVQIVGGLKPRRRARTRPSSHSNSTFDEHLERVALNSTDNGPWTNRRIARNQDVGRRQLVGPAVRILFDDTQHVGFARDAAADLRARRDRTARQPAVREICQVSCSAAVASNLERAARARAVTYRRRRLARSDSRAPGATHWLVLERTEDAAAFRALRERESHRPESEAASRRVIRQHLFAQPQPALPARANRPRRSPPVSTFLNRSYRRRSRAHLVLGSP